MSPPIQSVCVTGPARLHLGFIDLHGGLGREFGSLGLTLGGLKVRVSARHAPSTAVFGDGQQRVAEYVHSVQALLGSDEGVHVELHESIPAHVGLGSGTQLALAVATAVAELFGLPLDAGRAAAALDRGQRSGIGIGAFEQGGFVVDGGRGPATDVPPVVARLAFPEAWRVLLILDTDLRGLSGVPERAAFAQLPPMDEAVSGELARRVLLQVLPGLAEEDFVSFTAGIGRIQALVGDYFARCQGGGRYLSARVAEALALLVHDGVVGVGQSSWGPTGFAFFASESEAHRARDRVAADCAQSAALQFIVCRGRNRGADLTVVHDESPVAR